MNREIGDLALKRLGLAMLGSKGNGGIGGTRGWFDDVVNGFCMGLNDGARGGNLITGDGDVFDGVGCSVFDDEFG